MTVEVTSGDLFRSGAEALVNPVNTVGVMGKGLALSFKHRFPDAFDDYVRACRVGDLHPGGLWTFMREEPPRYIIHFATKAHWRDHSKLVDIELGLHALRDQAERFDIQTVALPAVGCGLGGLPWPAVLTLIRDVFENHPGVHVLAYPPWP